jgi:PadR family transcriptional regulator PadR
MAGPSPRMTQSTQMVLRALLEHPDHHRYGLELCVAAGLPSGTIHPILARLEHLGWVESHWEDTDPAQAGRPRRRYYRLTPDGAEKSRNALAQAHTRISAPPGLRPGLAGGPA